MEHIHNSAEINKFSNYRLAFSATVHCLIGCGLGEVMGMVIAVPLGLDNHTSMILAIVLGIIGGFSLGIVPLRKAGFSWKFAGLGDLIFWEGMILGLAAGFIAAYPVNYIFVKKGIRHMH